MSDVNPLPVRPAATVIVLRPGAVEAEAFEVLMVRRNDAVERLEQLGAKIFIGHDASNVDDSHVVVYSSAVSRENVEVRVARERQIPVIPRAEMLAELMRLKYGIAVAGTHGKTTTTSLIGAVLAEGRHDPTVIVGGRVTSLGGNARMGQGEFLVAEADESDGSFLKLDPTIAVVTTIDAEHLDPPLVGGAQADDRTHQHRLAGARPADHAEDLAGPHVQVQAFVDHLRAEAVGQPAHADDLANEIPAVVEMGIPTFKAFMVYDFGLSPTAIRVALRAAARSGGMLMVHGEDRAALEANIARLKAEGKTPPRYHAESRPPYVEAAGTRAAIEMARAEDAPVYLVHLSSQEALAEVKAGRSVGGQVFAETCPHFLVLDESRYELPDAQCACYIISPPLRSPADRDALWAALAEGILNVVSTDHVPDTVADKRGWEECFDLVSNGAPGIETLLALVYGHGVARGRLTVERMVEVLSTTPAQLFGMSNKGAIEPGKDADIVLFDPQERRTIAQSELHHTSDFTPYEGIATSGLVRSTIVRGEFVVRDGRFVGRRGFGQFLERTLPR